MVISCEVYYSIFYCFVIPPEENSSLVWCTPKYKLRHFEADCCNRSKTAFEAGRRGA